VTDIKKHLARTSNQQHQTLAIEKEYAPLEHNPGAYSVGK
jgi:hypothetical protein